MRVNKFKRCRSLFPDQNRVNFLEGNYNALLSLVEHSFSHLIRFAINSFKKKEIYITDE